MRPATPLASVLALMTLMVFSSEHALAAAGDQLSTNKTNVNVRTSPSTGAEVVTTIDPGEVIIEVDSKGDWYFVELPRRLQQGWVYAPLVGPVNGSGSEQAAPARVAPAPAPLQPAPQVAQPATPRVAPAPAPVRQAPQVARPATPQVAPAPEVARPATPRVAPAPEPVGETPRGFPSASSLAKLEARLPTFNPSLPGNPRRGETVFYKCGSCHTSEPGIHAQGPSLHGIFGRRPANEAGFRYSGAMQAFAREGAVWDGATLDRFIQRPARVVKGTSMPFSGVRDQQDRRDLIAYLQQLGY